MLSHLAVVPTWTLAVGMPLFQAGLMMRLSSTLCLAYVRDRAITTLLYGNNYQAGRWKQGSSRDLDIREGQGQLVYWGQVRCRERLFVEVQIYQ